MRVWCFFWLGIVTSLASLPTCTELIGIHFIHSTLLLVSLLSYVFDEKSTMFLPRDYAEGFLVDLQRAACHTCGAIFGNLHKLQIHLKKVHNGQQHCSVCLKEKKVFLREQQQYKWEDLKRHMSHGDGLGFRGHPFCKFCNVRMYDNIQLYEHLTKEHYKCHICEEYKYFKEYNDLEEHFRVSHFLCEHEDCLSLRFQVFPTDIDLTAHIVKSHPGMKPPRINLSFRVGRKCDEERKETGDVYGNGEEVVHEWAPENIQAAEQNFRRRSSVDEEAEDEFPSLSSVPARNMASWVRSGQTLRRHHGISDEKFANEEFPALTVPTSPARRTTSSKSQRRPVEEASQCNVDGSNFRNALMPYPTPAMVAAVDTDQWTYTTHEELESNTEIQLGNIRVKRNNKNRKNRRKQQLKTPPGVAAPSPVEQIAPPPPIEGAAMSIHRLLGDEDYESFRFNSLSFRAGDISALDLYQKAKELLPEVGVLLSLCVESSLMCMRNCTTEYCLTWPSSLLICVYQDQFLDLFTSLVKSLPDRDKAEELEVVIMADESMKGQKGPESLKWQQKKLHSPAQHSDIVIATASRQEATAPASALVSNNCANITASPQAASSGFNIGEEKHAEPAAQPQKVKQVRKGGGNKKPGSASTWISAMNDGGNLSQKGKTGLSVVKAKDSKSRKAANAKLSV